MSSVLNSKVYTGTLTNITLTLTEGMGVKKISIYNGSTVTGTVTGTLKLAGNASAALDIAQGETITFESSDASVIVDLIITAPASCTLNIVAQG